MYILYLVVRILLYPFVRYFLPLFNDKAYKRMEFEYKNVQEKKPFEKADCGFEVSSQGELEQVKILIMSLLSSGKKVELVLCSESVEKECQELSKSYPGLLALYRMPIICFHPWLTHFNPKKWLTCDTFIMCRYDFFPSLVSYGTSVDQFILLAGTLKNFENKNYILKTYLERVYLKFTKIVTSHNSDKEKFIQLLKIDPQIINVHDFRVDQITWRLESANTNVVKKLGNIYKLIEFFKSLETNQRLIFGSLWPGEVPILKEFTDDMNPKSFLIVPHKLAKADIQVLASQLIKTDLHYSFVDVNTTVEELEEMIEFNKKKNYFYILNFQGILCELYSYFNYAYVGGGFGESVHSLLEPYLAGNYVFCGPNIHRSTEYNYIKEINPNRVTICPEKKEVASAIFSKMDRNKNAREVITQNADVSFKSLLEWLEIAK